MRRANKLVGSWMRDAGMQVREDAAFNLIGRWNSAQRGAKTFLLGSHLDTVRDAGKYDGPLGVLTAIAAVQLLRERGVKLPFHLEIVGFSDEEGVRYQTAYLGSNAFAGTLKPADLARIQEKQIVKARRREKFLGYAEVHIEQGPVLEAKNLPVGVVTAIAGQSRDPRGISRRRRTRRNRAHGSCATTPSPARRNLCSPPKRCGVTATVGKIEVAPGASNVIPGKASLTLDIRHQNDSRRLAAVKSLHAKARAIAETPRPEIDLDSRPGKRRRAMRQKTHANFF